MSRAGWQVTRADEIRAAARYVAAKRAARERRTDRLAGVALVVTVLLASVVLIA